MKKSNEILYEKNRELILSSLPSTYYELRNKLNIHFNTIYNHLKILLNENKIHVDYKMKIHKNGPLVDHYNIGPKPEFHRPIIIKQPDRIPKQHSLILTFYSDLYKNVTNK